MLLARRLYNASILMLALLLLAACDSTALSTTPAAPVVSVTASTDLPAHTPISPSTSQKVEGITMSVQPLQADAHRISLAISVDGPARPYAYEVQWYSWEGDNDLPNLSVGDKVLTWTESASASLGPPARSGERLHGHGVLVFDGSGLHDISTTLPLSLSIPLYIYNNPYFPPEPFPTSAAPVADTPTSLPHLTRSPSVLRFAFSMTISFDSRQTVVHMGQTVENSDVAITLEQIDITASEARVMLRYSPAKPDSFLKWDDWVLKGPLYITSGSNIGPISLPENLEDEEYPTDHGCYASSSIPCALSYLAPPFPRSTPVDCTLTITAYRTSPSSGPWPQPPPYGTWVFHFTVPMASK